MFKRSKVRITRSRNLLAYFVLFAFVDDIFVVVFFIPLSSCFGSTVVVVVVVVVGLCLAVVGGRPTSLLSTKW